MEVVEHVSSRSETVGGDGTNDDAELVFHVFEGWSPLAVRAAVYAASPLTYHQLVRQNMKLIPLGAGLWNVKVPYSKIQRKISVTIDAMCEKVKTMRSIATIANVRVRYTGPNQFDAAPDFKGMIGVGKDTIEGVEIYETGSFKLTMQWSAKYATIRNDYIYTVMSLGATVNSLRTILYYKGQAIYFDKGSLLLVGGTFNETSDDGCDITLKFEGRFNDAAITVGDLDGAFVTFFTGTTTNGDFTITGMPSTTGLKAGMILAALVPGSGIRDGTQIISVIDGTSIFVSNPATNSGDISGSVYNKFLTSDLEPPTKEGHWYVWLRTKKVRDDPTKPEIEVVDTAHIEQVYKYADFSQLEVFDTIENQDANIAIANEQQQVIEDEEALRFR